MHLYLAGDIGGYKTPDSLTNTLTWPQLHIASEDCMVLLGDNVYPKGVPHPYDPDYTEMASRLRMILDYCLDAFTAPIYLLPGNHDYDRGRTGGVLSWQSQVQVVRSFFEGKVVPVPTAPVLLKMKGINCILIDTQHYLQPEQEKSSWHLRMLGEDLIRLLDQCLGTPTVVCGHHPLYSRAMHGGKFSLREHLFPLSLLRKRLLVPLPGIGSAVALGRSALGAKEDIRHPRYQRLRTVLKQAFGRYENLVYAAGHDHNLQHYQVKGNHFIVSGSASKTAYVRAGGRSDFTARTLGCFRLGGRKMMLQAVEFSGKVLAEWTILPLGKAAQNQTN